MKFLTASALALTLGSTGAFAQGATGETQPASDGMQAEGESGMGATHDNLIRSRDITGGTVYTLSEASDDGWDPTNYYDAVGSDWTSIGEIEDLVLSRDGRLIGIVAEVGGFLDVGDKHVMIEVQDVNLVPVDDQKYAYVTRLSQEELESMQNVDEGFWN